MEEDRITVQIYMNKKKYLKLLGEKGTKTSWTEFWFDLYDKVKS